MTCRPSGGLLRRDRRRGRKPDSRNHRIYLRFEGAEPWLPLICARWSIADCPFSCSRIGSGKCPSDQETMSEQFHPVAGVSGAYPWPRVRGERQWDRGRGGGELRTYRFDLCLCLLALALQLCQPRLLAASSWRIASRVSIIGASYLWVT